MAGQRRAELVSIPMGPGVLSNVTPRAAKTRVNYMNWDRWNDSDWVRWHKLLPEKLGGWQFQALVDQFVGNPITYIGLARGLHDWASIDGVYWVVIGTNYKLYIESMGVLYDVTPIRQTDNVANAFTTTNGTNLVTVVDPDNGAQDQDYVFISGATPVGGITLSGYYQITFVDPNTYTILAATNANANATGGGNVSLAYDITAGLPSNGELYGYGTFEYGEDEYGTPRPSGTGIYARLRSWSVDNYGEDLIASYSDGEIYWWQRVNGGNSHAALLDPTAPTGCQRVIVDGATRVLIALGCTDVTSQYDAMLVRWCDFDDITVWIPSDTNLAGDYPLSIGSRIVTGIRSKGQNLIWTDQHLYRMVLVGGAAVYAFYGAGTTQIVGPNAAIDVDGVAYWMGFDNLYTYTGTIGLLPCEVWETVFDPNNSTSLLRSQSEKVYCFAYEARTEITWLYPSIGGSGECDRYLTYNWDDQVFYYGAWNRTAAGNRTPALGGYPYGVNGGYLYQHEIGTDGNEATGTTPLGFYMESLDITTGGAKSEYTMGGSDARFAIGGSDSHLRGFQIVPDFQSSGGYFNGSMQVTIKTKDRPQQNGYVINGPVVFDDTTEDIFIDFHGSQIRMRFDNYLNSDPYFDDVVLLLPFDGANGSTDFPDLSDADNTMTAVGAAQISTATPKFGSGALLLDGSTALATCPITPGSPLDLSSCASFTVEGWAYLGSPPYSYRTLLEMGNVTGGNGFFIAQFIAATPAAFGIWTSSGELTIFPSVQFLGGGWSHFALVLNNGVITLYFGGVAWGSASLGSSVILPFDGVCSVGGSADIGSYYQGQIDEVRITRNVARYTKNFTPPALSFPTSAQAGAAAGVSFRMGVLQALAVPHAKR